MRNEENEVFFYFFKHVEILLNTIGIDRQKFCRQFFKCLEKIPFKQPCHFCHINISNVSPTDDFV